MRTTRATIPAALRTRYLNRTALSPCAKWVSSIHNQPSASHTLLLWRFRHPHTGRRNQLQLTHSIDCSALSIVRSPHGWFSQHHFNMIHHGEFPEIHNKPGTWIARMPLPNPPT